VAVININLIHNSPFLIDCDYLREKDMGLVNEVFNPEKLEKLNGNIGVGHVRYSTAGSSICITDCYTAAFLSSVLKGKKAIIYCR